jgi:hypothetical protein
MKKPDAPICDDEAAAHVPIGAIVWENRFVREFWVSSGHHLTRRTEQGELAITDALLQAYLARPELVPPEEACLAERRLHAALLAEPRRRVVREELQALADPDARQNWEVMLGFRDRLLAAGSVEAAYLQLVRQGAGHLPALFLDQLVHLILRNALDGCDDPFVLRAAELMFRPQRVSFHEGTVLLADDEIIEAREQAVGRSPLLAMLGREPVAELDVLTQENAWTYWSRSDAFTMVLNLGSDPAGRAAIAQAIEAWVAHLLQVAVRVEPVAAIEDREWRWFVGLDAEATRIGNALWSGSTLGEDARMRVLALFRLTLFDPQDAEEAVRGHPVYLILAMTPDRRVRMKPQNLVVGLPVRAGRYASAGENP